MFSADPSGIQSGGSSLSSVATQAHDIGAVLVGAMHTLEGALGDPGVTNAAGSAVAALMLGMQTTGSAALALGSWASSAGSSFASTDAAGAQAAQPLRITTGAAGGGARAGAQ